MVDIDSTFSYSNIANVSLKSETSLVVYPNPVIDQLNISFNSPTADNASIIVIDYLGRKLYEKSIRIEKGNNFFKIDTKTLAAGKYVLLINNISNYRTSFIKN